MIDQPIQPVEEEETDNLMTTHRIAVESLMRYDDTL
jgi:hypothetical protein